MASKKRGASASPRRRSAAEMQKWYNENKAKLQAFEQANDAVKQLRDVTKNAARTINTVDKETVIGYLQNPNSNEANLRNTSWYLYTRSSTYRGIVDYFASMLCMDARTVIPDYDPTSSSNDDQKMLKSWYDTVTLLRNFNLDNEMHKMMTYALIQDISPNVVYADQTGIFLLPLPADYVRVVGQYDEGDYQTAFRMDWFTQRQDFLTYWGQPWQSMWNAYQSGGGDNAARWQIIPPEYSATFLYSDDYSSIIPIFSGIFSSLIDLLDVSDIAAVAAQQDIYKLVYMKLPLLSNSSNPDAWAVDPATMSKYFSIFAQEALPDYSAGALIPGEDLGVVDFSSSNKAAEENKVLEAQKNVYNGASVGHVLNSSQISGTSAYENAMQANIATGTKLLPTIEHWLNRIIGNVISDPAWVHFYPTSRYTKKEMRKNLLEESQYALPQKLGVLSMSGIDPVQALSLSKLENDILDLGNKFNQPLSSSFTSSNTGKVGEGAPTKDTEDLTDEGERSRER